MKRVFLLLIMCSPVMAQSSGWGDLGSMLGGGAKRDSDEVYRKRYMENIEAINALEQAKAARSERQLLELELSMQQELIQLWLKLGLDESEAKSISSSFRLTEELLAHIARAKREGFKVTLEAAKLAYHNRQYLLANQLLVAATREGVPQP